MGGDGTIYVADLRGRRLFAIAPVAARALHAVEQERVRVSIRVRVIGIGLGPGRSRRGRCTP